MAVFLIVKEKTVEKMKWKLFREKNKQMLSLLLSVVLALMVFVPYLPPIQLKAAESDGSVTLTSAHGDFGGDHKLYCIDKGGLAIWGIAAEGDKYAKHSPSQTRIPLSKQDQEYVFWGILTLQASMGIKEANDVINRINDIAPTQGKVAIRKFVTEEDLKALIYRPDVRAKYPWLETVAANTEDYLKMAGLIGTGNGTTQSGKKIPDVIANCTSPGTAYQISRSDFTIPFDASGADADFIEKVPILFWDDASQQYTPTSSGGWTYTKTSTSITFHNPNPKPPKMMIRFAVEGTEYATTSGGYASEEDLFEQCLQIWECVQCSGTHKGGTPPTSPTEIHQRMVWLKLEMPENTFYAVLGGDPVPESGSADVVFHVFRHAEDFTSTYNVQMYKYDSETGKPLEGARFVLYERFDDQGRIDTEKDGPVHIYEGGEPYASYHTDDPVIWDGFRKIGTVVTDPKGHAEKRITHGYHYDKTFCDGHPAPVFVPVPEPEEDEETGEVLNSEAIESAKAANQAAAQKWVDTVTDCEEKASGAFEGVHFHWMMEDVNQGEIESVANSGGDEGSTPDGGNTTEPDGETAYEKSGCHQDMLDTYEAFISLKYSYAFTEFQAKDGYIRHDGHSDDLPIEIITTDASEHGANAFFSGEYSDKKLLEAEGSRFSLQMPVKREKKNTETFTKEEMPEKKARPILFQEIKEISQAILSFIMPEEELEEEIEEEEIEEDVEEQEESENGQVSFFPHLEEIGKEPGNGQNSSSTQPENAEKEPEKSQDNSAPHPEDVEKEPGSGQNSSSTQTENAEKESEKSQDSSTHHQVDVEKELGSSVPSDGKEENPKAEISSRIPILVKASGTQATPSNVEDKPYHKRPVATSSDAAFQWSMEDAAFYRPDVREGERNEGGSLFPAAYEEARSSNSVGAEIDPGSNDYYSHCNDADGEGNAWRIYDHRTEAEFHINKKDLDLSASESETYDSYGDTQGDTTLEGAVYGLFAAEDIFHPDGKTGIVYKANNLVAVAATDRNGDASFLVNTEAPGRSYDYKTGTIVDTPDGWVSQAPKNLYTDDSSYDDYTEDGAYERTYSNNEKNNGNCWIGRPLLLGDYYVKELSRSEGYELSVGNKKHDLTNQGQELNAGVPEGGQGYAVISELLYADEQTSEDGTGAGPNELFFSARSKDTKDQRYDIVLSNLPKGVEMYRKEVGTKQVEVSVGTGTYEKVWLKHPDGSPKYVTADHDYQYPKYNADGSLMTEEVSMNYVASDVRQVSVRSLDEASVQEILNRGEEGMTEAQNLAELSTPFTSVHLPFVKGKVEAALRRNGKSTPRSKLAGGGYDYSSIYAGVFDSGVRKGDPDHYGLSGVQPGSPAAYTVYGSPVQVLAVDKTRGDGTALTVGDAILSVLDYYNSHPYYSYGGIDMVSEKGGTYLFTVYASVTGNPDNFMVLGTDAMTDSIIYHGVNYLPEDPSLSPRRIYATYSNNPKHKAFGTYEDYSQQSTGSSVLASALLVTDAVADEKGNLQSKTIQENVYYKTGELVRDSEGKLMQAYEYREIMKTEKQEVEEVKWTKLPAERQEDGTYVLSVEAAYTDAFGVSHTNAGKEQTISFKAVLKEKEIVLSKEEAGLLGPGFMAGKPMGSASYHVHVKKAKAKAYLDYHNANLVGDNTYVVITTLTYPGQEQVYEDNGTRKHPAQVYERPIRQRVKVVKDIQTRPDGSYENNTYDYPETDREANFRFKAYLKSNLERLYRDEAGAIVWMDRNGNEISYEEMLKVSDPMFVPKDGKREGEKHPKLNVPKIFTKVLHDTTSTLTSINGNNIRSDYKDPEAVSQNAALRIPFTTSIAPGGVGVLVNAALYSYRGQNTNTETTPQIREEANQGYTRLLELSEYQAESGTERITVQDYNYDKFFDAIETANTDKWDEKNQTYTSWKPLGNAAKRTEYAINNAKASDKVRQFAITWYLDDEVAKRVKHNGQGEDETKKDEAQNLSSEAVYDEALNAALEKAYHYLAPFFQYDLDEVYAVAWDGAADGGEDEDPTTVCAGTEGSDYFYGISAYLPYGTYVIAEQQPNKELPNKHYQMDRPKEIQVPSVYEAGTNTDPVAELSRQYQYDADQSLNSQASEENFLIRFGEEWNLHAADQREYVIRAHNHDGDFEVYKYGLEPDKLTGTISYDGESYDYQGFSITQEAFDPLKDSYHPVHKVRGKNLTREEGANENSHYFADDKNKGMNTANGGTYRQDAIEERYSYGSISEQAGEAGNIRVMEGVGTAYDGRYAPMLVPYSVLEPEKETAYDADGFKGYADEKFRNTFYSTRLRIEKLDSETHEPLLHDGALFMIYKASRNETTGEVQFYEEDTLLTGSEEFLKAMGASDIKPMKRGRGAESKKKKREKASEGPGTLYSGTVKAGTPICQEKDKIVMSDAKGKEVGQFEAFSTVNDVSMKQEDTNQAPNEYRLQTTGYLTIPQPLGAGVYVLAEIPPKGYVRTAPIAIEIYSDKVTYYKEGKKEQRIHAAIYEDHQEHMKANRNPIQNPTNTAQIYVENTPIQLQVEKLKKEGTVTFRIGERIEGSITEIGQNPALQYAYDDNGVYLGYAYPKGTLERLAALKEAGEQVEIVYDGNHFAGYGYVTRTRETEDDENPYVAGAKLTLFDAIPLTPSGDQEDLAYEGLSITRNLSNNVTKMMVKQGYAGKKMELMREVDENGEYILTDYVTGMDSEGNPMTEQGYVWKEGMAERPDTEILYYDLDGLSLTWTEKVDGKPILYGWNKEHQKVSVFQLQDDQANVNKTDRELSLYAFKGGQPYLEFVGGDLTKLSYDRTNKILNGNFAALQYVSKLRDWKMSEGTVVYHLDRQGNRDAMVDPYTGMAYVLEPKLDKSGNHVADRVLVWPVEISRDAKGAVIARDKITTSRIATVGENQEGYGETEVIEPNNQTDQELADDEKPSYSHQESGYINGTWQSEKGEESHKEQTIKQNKKGQNMNGEILFDRNNGTFLQSMSPVYDEHGLVLYYQRSGETYDKGTELYDRNGDFVRYKNSDNLEAYNDAAYALDDPDDLFDGKFGEENQIQDRLYHRRGESYILENTWLTSDQTPNDPFSNQELAGQADFIKRLSAGTYILEELAVPEGEGYTKSFPTGVTVEEKREIKQVQIHDDTTKEYFEKIDGTENSNEPAAHYTNRALPGAELALYPARYLADPDSPEGWRLEKTSDTPYQLQTTNSREGKEEYKEMAWTTEERPLYVEGLPAGWYLLEETLAPAGFLKAEPMKIRIEDTQEIQNFRLFNDHTKVAFRKYKEQRTKKEILPGAEFTLYEAKTDAQGTIVYDKHGHPQYEETRPVESWISDDATDYTDTIELRNYPNTGGKKGQTGFTLKFEQMYEEYGIHGTGFTWYVERTAVRDSNTSKVWKLEDGSRIIIGKDEATGKETVTFPTNMSREDKEGFQAAYSDMLGEKRSLQWAVSRTAEVTGRETLDASMAGGTASKYPDVAKVTLGIKETGKTVLADVRYNGADFEYSYQFDYHRLSHVGEYAHAWLTADGSRRMDYLPVGGSYVLVETKAPEGFAAIPPLLVTVEEENGIQLHEILNERSALAVSKRSSATGKELPGAELALYQADETGELNQTDPYFVAAWISGTDGVYTEKDKINGLIPEGFSQGDLKPHYLYDLPDGTYYLVEQKAPDYYQAAKPFKFEYHGEKQNLIQIERMTNEPITGELMVKKTNEEGDALSGVVFELSAYQKNGHLVSGFPMTVSDNHGTVHVRGLPVGRVHPENGRVEPYRYQLKEILPPDGFAVNPTIYTFTFSNGEGTYTEDGTIHTILHETEVKNEKTKIYLEKRELSELQDEGTDGAFIQGAKLAVYQITEVNEEGDYTYQEEDLVEQWTTSKAEGRHLLEGLIAGQTYVLVELQAPEGYTLMKPVLFTVKGDGRGIASISNNRSVVQVNYREESPDNGDTDSIDSITVKGRTLVKTETAVLNEQGKELLRFTETGEKHPLRPEDGLQENGLYTFEEHTIYSDGSDVVTRRSTRRIHLDASGSFLYQGRAAHTLKLSLADQKGGVITEFEPFAEKLETTVSNGVNPEHPKVIMRSQSGEAGEPLQKGQAVISTITWYNPKHTAQDLTIQATVEEGMEILDPYEGAMENNTITWTIHQAAPLSQGSVSFAGALTGSGSSSAVVSVTVQDTEGETFASEKEVPVIKENSLTIYNELTGSGKEQHQKEESRFTIRLWNRHGEELGGTYAYTGSKEGTLKSGDTVELAGNEFILLDPVLKNCTYQVSREEDGTKIEAHQTEGLISEEGTAAWFTRNVEDTTERAVFVKGNTYVLTETTGYSDGTETISNRLSFTINEHGGLSVVGGYDKETGTVIEKVDVLTGEPVIGARMQLYERSKLPQEPETLVKEWITGEEPFSIAGLKPGTSYRLKEVMPPDGYGYALDMTFTVHPDGAVEQIRMEDQKTHIVVSKKDITNGEELPGAHLQILDRGGVVVEEWISGETPHEMFGKLKADETYTLRETIPAEGFVIAHEISFTVNHDGSINYVEMEDDTTKVRIYKNRYVEESGNGKPSTPSDAEEGTPIAGAVLQILNEDKTPAMYEGKEMIFTTTESFHLLEKQLIAGNTYWLHEIKPAFGYGYAEDVKFTVSTDGSMDVVVMEDKPTRVILSKKAITGEEELPGCEMQLIDEEGMVIDQWISGEQPHEITGILEADHTYHLIEVSPAPGYAYAKKVTFTVHHDGTVNQVEMRDDVTKVEILKVDSKQGEPLSGAEFEILDQAGTVLEHWTSTGEPHRIYGKLTAGETYILHEVSAPSGYQKMADVEFTVNDYADVLTVTAENRKKGDGGSEDDFIIRLKKVDENGKPLPGAAFTVTDKNGHPLTLEQEHHGTTFKVSLKTPQTITVTEVYAPDGYEKLTNSYQIQISKKGDAVLLNGDDSFYQDSENSYVFFAVNHRKPDIQQLKGKITVKYDKGLYGNGSTKLFENNWKFSFVKTGDEFPYEIVIAVFVLSVSGLAVLAAAKKRKKKEEREEENRG